MDIFLPVNGARKLSACVFSLLSSSIQGFRGAIMITGNLGVIRAIHFVDVAAHLSPKHNRRRFERRYYSERFRTDYSPLKGSFGVTISAIRFPHVLSPGPVALYSLHNRSQSDSKRPSSNVTENLSLSLGEN